MFVFVCFIVCVLGVRDLACDSDFQYVDIYSVLNTENHFIFDSLRGANKVQAAYYFLEKPNTSKLFAMDSVTRESHPVHVPSHDLSFSSSSSSSSSTSSSSSHSLTPIVCSFFPEIRAIFKVGTSMCGHKGDNSIKTINEQLTKYVQTTRTLSIQSKHIAVFKLMLMFRFLIFCVVC